MPRRLLASTRWLLYRLGFIVKPGWVPAAGLESLNAIGPDGNSHYDWEASTNDPQFIWQGRLPRAGWNMLELSMRFDQPTAAARLYFDTGDGFNDGQSVLLPVRKGKLAKRLCWIPDGLRAIRFDPLETEGRLTIDTCRLTWVTNRFARSRIVYRLGKRHKDFRDMSGPAIIRSMAERAKATSVSMQSLMYSFYEETFKHFETQRNYPYWLEFIEPQREPTYQGVIQALATLNYQPKISILLPTYNTDVAWLNACIDSVMAQRYPHWQLCIADDASTKPETKEALAKWSSRDKRIQVIWRKHNGHISRASNDALSVAEGDYIALLDHDDQLAPNALFHVVEALNQPVRPLFLYSDEDKLNDNGERWDPYFKPDWNPDLLLSQNYVSHLGVYEAKRMREIGGFRAGFEGSQDHDLVLRFTRGLDTSLIRHLPYILYHWRAIEGSTALDGGEKSYAADAGLRAVSDHVVTIDAGATVTQGRAPNSYRVSWSLPEPAPLVSLLIPTRDGVDILKPCVDAILNRTEYANFEILILDNQSQCQQTLSYLEDINQDSRVRVLKWDYPFNYSSINNFGAKHARGEVIGLINNDIEPIGEAWLAEMMRQALRSEIGCVGAMLYYPDESIQHAGVILGLGGVAGHSHKYFPRRHPGYFHRLNLVQNLSAVTAACLLVRKQVFDEVGGLNEADLPVAFNDVDFCLRVREAGYRNLWTPYAELYHHESISRGVDDNPAKQARARREVEYMRQRWAKALDNDPAYNPNLTLAYEDFSLR